MAVTRRGFLGFATGLAAGLAPTGHYYLRRSKNEVVANDPADAGVTADFTKLAKQYPWLNDLRASIGLLENALDSFVSLSGSVIVLDDKGSLICCGHQLEADKVPTVSFTATRNRPLERDIVYPAVRFRNMKQDLALASIAQTDLQRFNLKPIRWNTAALPNIKDALYVGFLVDRLHAVPVGRLKYAGTAATDAGTFSCQASANVGYFNMDGGGIFADGKLAGIITAANRAKNYFTPASVIHKAHTRLLGTGADIEFEATEATRPECVFDRNDYIKAGKMSPA